MRVAVCCTDGCISPAFDWAKTVLIVDREGQDETRRQNRSLEGVAPARRPGELTRLGVDVLLCGGISEKIAEAFAVKGIRVLAGLSGDVEEVLAAFYADRLPDPAYTMPGWRFVPPGEGAAERDEHGRPGGRGRSSRRGDTP
jgi:predicted Fe-Mo cluster-binding NifX family protein